MKSQTMWRIPLLVAIFVFSSNPELHASAKLRYSKSKAIERVTQVSAAKLDSRLPDEPFGAWLAKTLAVDEVKWEVQIGCGDPHNGRPHDVCVSALVPFADQIEIGVFMKVGTVTTLQPTPTVDLLFSDWLDLSHYQNITSLPELADFAKACLSRFGPRPSNST